MMKTRNGLLCILFALLVSLWIPAPAEASDVSIDTYAYGDPYITVHYDGYGVNPEVFAYAGTSPLPGKKTKVYNGKYHAASGTYRIKIPALWKVGAKFTVRCISWNEEYETINIDVEQGKVVQPSDEAYTYWFITDTETKVKVCVENVHKGDQIKIKIGKKTYTKKITKAAKKKTYSVKVNRAKAGTKMTVWLVNKYKQKMANKDSTVIYKYRAVQLGMTKSQVKLTIGWRYPSKVNQSAYSEQWCYDEDGDGLSDQYLYFDRNGKVSNWHILG